MRRLAHAGLLHLVSIGLQTASKHKFYFERRLGANIIHIDAKDLVRLADIASQAFPYIANQRPVRDASRSPSLVASKLSQLLAPFLFLCADDDNLLFRRIGGFVSLSSKLAGKDLGQIPTTDTQEIVGPLAPMMPLCILLAFRLLSMHADPGCRITCVTKEQTYVLCFPANAFADGKGQVSEAFRELFVDFLMVEPAQRPSIEWFINRVLSASDAQPHIIDFKDDGLGIPDDAPLFHAPPPKRAREENPEDNAIPLPPPKRIQQEELVVVPAVASVSSQLVPHTVRRVGVPRPVHPSPPVSSPTDDGMMVGAALAAFQAVKAMYFGH